MSLMSILLPAPIRKDQDRQHLRQLLLDGAASEPTKAVDDVYFDILRERAGSRTAQ